jgi:hypothetical protein
MTINNPGYMDGLARDVHHMCVCNFVTRKTRRGLKTVNQPSESSDGHINGTDLKVKVNLSLYEVCPESIQPF